MKVLGESASDTFRIRIGQENGLSMLETWLFLPHPVESVFPFFADARNLESITPPWLHFKILTPDPIPMQSGAFIEYKLRLHRIPLRWLTEITAWDPPYRFVDEQKHGPYRTWIHEHTFKERSGGCEVHDAVRYSVPGGWLVDRLFVRREVRRIFEYRAQKLRRIFE